MEHHDLIIGELAEEFKSLCAELLAGEVPEELGLDAIEERTETGLRQIGIRLIACQIERLGTGHEGNRRRTPVKATGVFKGIKEKQVTTRLGDVSFASAQYYVRKQKASWYPLDERLGITDGFSPGLKRACASASVVEPFEGGMELVRDILGWRPMSARTAEEQAESYGKMLKARRDERVLEVMNGESRMAETEIKTADTLCVTCDGTTAHVREEGWKEAKLGAVYRLDEEGEAADISYTGGFEEAEGFGRILYAEACRRGIENAKTVVMLGDGACWIWNLKSEHIPQAVEILDYAHAKEHLYDLAKELYGEGTRASQVWAQEKETLLYDGKIEKLLTSFRRTKAKMPEGREKLKSTITYYENNRHRMKYDEYRAKGYHIGSGIAEAACKQLVGQRLKQSGMRWSREGAETMLQLKILRTNRQWDILKELQRQEAAWLN